MSHVFLYLFVYFFFLSHLRLTVSSPVSATGMPRPGGTSNQGGQLLRHADEDNNDVNWDVISTGPGELLCLGSDVYGRWSRQCMDLVPKLAR